MNFGGFFNDGKFFRLIQYWSRFVGTFDSILKSCLSQKRSSAISGDTHEYGHSTASARAECHHRSKSQSNKKGVSDLGDPV